MSTCYDKHDLIAQALMSSSHFVLLKMRIVLFLVTFFARAQDNNLLDDLTVLIEDFTDGSGFSFDENFPDVNVNTANVTAEIIEQIETQFGSIIRFFLILTYLYRQTM